MQMHKETLQAELKMVREDIHRVTLELTERQQRVEKLHAKHDVLVSRNATPDGEVHSQVRLLHYHYSAKLHLVRSMMCWAAAMLSVTMQGTLVLLIAQCNGCV